MTKPTRNSPTVADLINPQKRFAPEVLQAIKAYRRSKPWQGTLDERMAKLLTLHQALCTHYQIEATLILLPGRELPDGQGMGNAAYNRQTQTIYLAGRPSLVSYLHTFTRARGAGRREAFVWSLTLFSRMFKRSFAARRQVGPYLVY